MLHCKVGQTTQSTVMYAPPPPNLLFDLHPKCQLSCTMIREYRRIPQLLFPLSLQYYNYKFYLRQCTTYVYFNVYLSLKTRCT
jgi:hypothetical protein